MFQNKSIQACTPKSRSTRPWPIRCCCEHACACCRMSQYRVAWITGYKGWPTSCCCEHTHMCVAEKNAGLNPRTKGCQGCGKPRAAYTSAFQKNSSRLHPRVKGYTGLADQLLLRAYTCVLQSISIQGCTYKCQGLQ